MLESEYFVRTKCSLQRCPIGGRHLVARESLPEGAVVLVSPALATAISPTHKKRVCNYCFQAAWHRLHIHCEACQQVWYCSTECREADQLEQGHSSVPQVKACPHALTCRTLTYFSRCKCDPEMECVLRLALELLTLRRHEAGQRDKDASSPAAVPVAAQLRRYGGSALHSRPRWQDFEVLQSHADNLPDKDRLDWMVACKFLVKALRHGGWCDADVPSSQEVMHVLGRIMSNNFAMYVQITLPNLCPNLHRLPGSSCKDKEMANEGSLCTQAATESEVQSACLISSNRTVTAPASNNAVVRLVDSAVNDLECRPSEAGEDQGSTNSTPSTPLPALQVCAAQLSAAGDVDHCSNKQQLALRRTVPCAHAAPDAARLQIHTPTQVLSGSTDTLQLLGPTLTLDRMQLNALSPNVPHVLDPENNRQSAASTPAADPLQFHSSSHNPIPQPVRSSTNSASVLLQQQQPSMVATAEDTGLQTDSTGLLEISGGYEAGEIGTRLLTAGRLMFSTASYFNHSCAPNCAMDKGLRVGTVTAIQPIQAGDPLHISYINLEQPRSARQQYLRRNFFFDCVCSRCTLEAAQGSQKCSYTQAASSTKSGKTFAPKKRGRKARISR